MTQNDIEKLLQQYGEDQRQQQHAAEHVRGLARRQAHRRTALACVTVVGAIVGTMMHHWQQMPEPTGTLVAENHITVTTPSDETPLPSVAISDAHPTHLRTTSAKLPDMPTTATEDELIVAKPPLPTNPSCEDALTEIILPKKSEPTILPNEPELPILPFSQDYDIADLPTQPPETGSRFHFTASVGTSTISETALAADQGNLTGLDATTNYTYITPTSTYSANIGVAYTLASNSRRHFDVGVTLNGYSQQSDLHIHEMEYTYVYNAGPESYWASNMATDVTTSIPNSTDIHHTFNTFSLYAGVPLTLNMHPRGNDRMGWQLSLTPSHNLAFSRRLGNGNSPFLNPWKLTIGVGIIFPNNVVRHIGLTANLLSLYSTQPIHEFGIEIGI